MKKIVILLVMLCVSFTYAQDNDNVQYVEKGDLTEATYFYDNGIVRQVGTFNKDGQLHGVWTSYDINGDKIAVGNYVEGKKTGKWLFWTKDNVVREVNYNDSKIVSVNKREVAF